jgi:hypothetical protein
LAAALAGALVSGHDPFRAGHRGCGAQICTGFGRAEHMADAMAPTQLAEDLGAAAKPDGQRGAGPGKCLALEAQTFGQKFPLPLRGLGRLPLRAIGDEQRQHRSRLRPGNKGGLVMKAQIAMHPDKNVHRTFFNPAWFLRQEGGENSFAPQKPCSGRFVMTGCGKRACTAAITA